MQHLSPNRPRVRNCLRQLLSKEIYRLDQKNFANRKVEDRRRGWTEGARQTAVRMDG